MEKRTIVANRLVLVAIYAMTCGCQTHTNDADENFRRTSDFQSHLKSMSDDELFAVGITAIDGGRWSVAWSTYSKEDIIAIHSALEKVNLSASGSFGHGSAGWYIEKEVFFTAQAALLQSKDVRRLGIKIVEPRVLPSQSDEQNRAPKHPVGDF